VDVLLVIRLRLFFQGAQEGFAVFSQKKNEPKRKVAAGFCCYESFVVGQ